MNQSGYNDPTAENAIGITSGRMVKETDREVQRVIDRKSKFGMKNRWRD